MYTPHTVTVYNVGENPETLEQEYNMTFLRGVFLDRRQAANIEKSTSARKRTGSLKTQAAIGRLNPADSAAAQIRSLLRARS